jgi:hypothetical protein
VGLVLFTKVCERWWYEKVNKMTNGKFLMHFSCIFPCDMKRQIRDQWEIPHAFSHVMPKGNVKRQTKAWLKIIFVNFNYFQWRHKTNCWYDDVKLTTSKAHFSSNRAIEMKMRNTYHVNTCILRLKFFINNIIGYTSMTLHYS